MSIQQLEEMGFVHQAGTVFLYGDLLFNIPEDKTAKQVIHMLVDKIYDIGRSAGFENGRQDIILGFKQLLNL